MRSLDVSYNNLTGLHTSWQRSSFLTASVPYVEIDLSHNKLQVWPPSPQLHACQL